MVCTQALQGQDLGFEQAFFHEWIYRFGKTVTQIPLRQASLAGAVLFDLP